MKLKIDQFVLLYNEIIIPFSNFIWNKLKI